MSLKLIKTIDTKEQNGIHSVLRHYSQVITCSPLSGNIHFWSFKSGKRVKTLHCLGKKICNVAKLKFHRNFLLISEYSGKMHLIDPRFSYARYLKHFGYHGAEILRVQQMKARKTAVISCDVFGIMNIWSVVTGEVFLIMNEKNKRVADFDITKSDLVAAGINIIGTKNENLIRFWDSVFTQNTSPSKRVEKETDLISSPHNNEIFSTGFAIEGDMLFSGGGTYGDNEVKAWDTKRKTFIFKFAEKSTVIIYIASFPIRTYTKKDSKIEVDDINADAQKNIKSLSTRPSELKGRPSQDSIKTVAIKSVETNSRSPTITAKIAGDDKKGSIVLSQTKKIYKTSTQVISAPKIEKSSAVPKFQKGPTVLKGAAIGSYSGPSQNEKSSTTSYKVSKSSTNSKVEQSPANPKVELSIPAPKPLKINEPTLSSITSIGNQPYIKPGNSISGPPNIVRSGSSSSTACSTSFFLTESVEVKNFCHSYKQLLLTISFDRLLSLWEIDSEKECSKVKSTSIPLQYHSIPYGGFNLHTREGKTCLLLSSSNYKNSRIFIIEL